MKVLEKGFFISIVESPWPCSLRSEPVTANCSVRLWSPKMHVSSSCYRARRHRPVIPKAVVSTDDAKTDDVALVSKISSLSVLDTAGSPDTTRTSRSAPTRMPSPSPETTWQLLTKCLYPCGLSKRRTTDQTVETGALMGWARRSSTGQLNAVCDSVGCGVSVAWLNRWS
ncbi:hypothetical protein SESBI_28993 [Sesbania bispinosa]|nr:hypothetical protein SESBI_28993 [Sesbania bispinosa]